MMPPSFRSKFFWGVNDINKFDSGLNSMIDAYRVKNGWFAGDNLIAIGRNLGFIDDKPFIEAWNRHAKTSSERGILWRTHTIVWAARHALRLEGDFMECGCYKGTTARIMADAVDLTGRRLYLYDLFEHEKNMAHHAMPEHGPHLFEYVVKRFESDSNTQVIQGFIPECFSQGIPDMVAFAHIDLNNTEAEIAALEAIEHRLTPGAVIVLDDFGAYPYRRQHVAETKWFGDRGRFVLELPTSQGLVIW